MKRILFRLSRLVVPRIISWCTASFFREDVAIEGVKYAPEMANTNRRVLVDIKNIVGGPRHPMAVSKRGLSE
jgi:hypothetical protein